MYFGANHCFPLNPLFKDLQTPQLRLGRTHRRLHGKRCLVTYRKSPLHRASLQGPDCTDSNGQQICSLLHQQGMVLIAPGWSNMTWFWDLVSSVGSDPFQASYTKDLVTQPFDRLLHWNLRNLNLHVWLLEPLSFRNKGFYEEVAARIEAPHRFSTRAIHKSKCAVFQSKSVSQMRWTSGRPL